MKKIKELNIAIVLPTIITKNGTAKQALELAKILKKRGHDVSFYTYAYFPKSAFEEFKGFTVTHCVDVEKSFIFRFVKNVSLLERYFLYIALLQIKKFASLFSYKQIDIINPHDWFGIWVTHGINSQAQIVANINDIPERIHGSFLEKIKLKYDRKFAKKLASVIVLDNMNRKKAIAWLNIESNKVMVVRSGINVEKYKTFNKFIDLRKNFAIPKKSFLLVCANLLATNRRYEDILAAMAKLKKTSPEIHLFILSKLDFNVEYAIYLKQIIIQHNLNLRVHFIDKFFSDEERMAYIKSCDLLIFPNSPQTWGLTALEAMALGVPVIVSNGSGVSEVLTNSENAYIYEQRNVNALAKQILTCIQQVHNLEKVASVGRKFVLENYSWNNFGNNIEKIMLQAINKHE